MRRRAVILASVCRGSSITVGFPKPCEAFLRVSRMTEMMVSIKVPYRETTHAIFQTSHLSFLKGS